jgi:hypothetical protein
MILPTKRITHDRCLLGIGAEVIVLLDEPKTVSRLWDEFKRRRSGAGTVTYDWFVLALDLLYMTGTVRLDKGALERTAI